MIHAHDAATPSLDPLRRVLAAAPALAAIAAAGFLVAPRAAPGLLALLAVAPSAALMVAARRVASPLPAPLLAAATAFGCYITVNAAWSATRAEAYGKVLFYWVALVLAAAAIMGLRQVEKRVIARMQQAIVGAMIVGAAALLFEVLSGALIGRTMCSLLPVLQPAPKHVEIADGWVTRIEPYVLNRNVAAMCFAAWPCFIMLRSLLGERRSRMVCVPLFAGVGLATLQSDHAASGLALVLGALTWAGMMLATRAMRFLVAAAWTAATLLAVPITALAFQQELQLAPWLPETARNRIVLWGVTASEVTEAPVLGVGVAATRVLDAAHAPTAARPEGYTYPLRTGRHAHNIFLQTWYELGGVGAVLLLALGLAGLAVLSRLPAQNLAPAFSSFVTVATIGAASWGMWQTWFMAAYGIWAVLLALALEGARRASDTRVS